MGVRDGFAVEGEFVALEANSTAQANLLVVRLCSRCVSKGAWWFLLHQLCAYRQAAIRVVKDDLDIGMVDGVAGALLCGVEDVQGCWHRCGDIRAGAFSFHQPCPC